MTIAATALTLILLAFRKGRELKSIRGNVNHFLVMGALLAIHFMLFISAVKDTSILNATVLVNTAPIFSTIISALFYRTKPSKLALAGMTMSSAGASLLAYGDFEQGEPASLVGDLEATLAAIAEGFYLNYGREKRRQISLLPAMLSIYLIAAFSVGTTMVVTERPWKLPPTLQLFYLS